MKYLQILLIITTPLFWSCSIQQSNTINHISSQLLKPDSAVIALMGNDLVSMLYEPDSIKCYTLNPLVRPDSMTKTIAGFAVNEYEGNVADNYISILQFLMQTEHNYRLDSLEKERKFTPETAFSFFKGKEKADVLIAMNCEMWGFYHNQKLKTESFKCKQSLIEFLRPIVTKNADSQ